jgi:hypothetical protein
MEPEIDLTQLENTNSNLDYFTLRILARVIALEERRTGRMSGLRVFCRMDISIYRATERGDHQYYVNEITRTHGGALFPKFDSNKRLNNLFNHMSNILHHISMMKLYQQSPPSF